jgi:hypothetical protein
MVVEQLENDFIAGLWLAGFVPAACRKQLFWAEGYGY